MKHFQVKTQALIFFRIHSYIIPFVIGVENFRSFNIGIKTLMFNLTFTPLYSQKRWIRSSIATIPIIISVTISFICKWINLNISSSILLWIKIINLWKISLLIGIVFLQLGPSSWLFPTTQLHWFIVPSVPYCWPKKIRESRNCNYFFFLRINPFLFIDD